MPRKKAGLSRERHQTIGLRLAQISDELTQLECEVLNAYPKANPTGNALRQVVKKVLTARLALEEACAGEPWQGAAASCLGFYWPSADERRARNSIGWSF